MKVSIHFKNAIQNYLEQRAMCDELFMCAYRKSAKNIDDCITYILNTVKKSGCSGFSDNEIYSMAIHYYDEDNIEIGNPLNDYNVVVNHHIELTTEEKEQARKKAVEQVAKDALTQMKQLSNRHKTPSKKQNIEQPTLFDF